MADTTAFNHYPLWIATYGPQPILVGGWSDYTFWQYTDGEPLAGMSAPVDMSVFKGSSADLAALADPVRVSPRRHPRPGDHLRLVREHRTRRVIGDLDRDDSRDPGWRNPLPAGLLVRQLAHLGHHPGLRHRRLLLHDPTDHQGGQRLPALRRTDARPPGDRLAQVHAPGQIAGPQRPAQLIKLVQNPSRRSTRRWPVKRMFVEGHGAAVSGGRLDLETDLVVGHRAPRLKTRTSCQVGRVRGRAVGVDAVDARDAEPRGPSGTTNALASSENSRVTTETTMGCDAGENSKQNLAQCCSSIHSRSTGVELALEVDADPGAELKIPAGGVPSRVAA